MIFGSFCLAFDFIRLVFAFNTAWCNGLFIIAINRQSAANFKCLKRYAKERSFFAIDCQCTYFKGHLSGNQGAAPANLSQSGDQNYPEMVSLIFAQTPASPAKNVDSPSAPQPAVSETKTATDLSAAPSSQKAPATSVSAEAKSTPPASQSTASSKLVHARKPTTVVEINAAVHSLKEMRDQADELQRRQKALPETDPQRQQLASDHSKLIAKVIATTATLCSS